MANTNHGEGNPEADKRYRTIIRNGLKRARGESKASDGTEAGTPVENLDTVRNLVSGASTVMLTSTNEKGGLSSRPMTLQDWADDGSLWFVVDKTSDWLREGALNVNVSFSENVDGWVSVSGVAFTVDDKDKLEELWDAGVEAWFEDGKDDANAVALRVDLRRAEWWSADNKLKQIWQIAKALVTDERPDLGNKGRIDVNGSLSH